ncbi:hypothetical protein [uncultured Dokdonia sp.]|uniref:hypothetical protein n=1 Tax=uncultured Dokdonia sp. TaxID=575653 RepID=UPI00261B12D0|nr:hypothetical protein [uncultured Dokdonia sp.]
MKYYLLYIRVMVLTISLFLCVSCVSDVDFDQTQDIVLSPTVDASLIFFTLDTSDFESVDTQEAVVTVRDTTRLEFLDDDFIRENLREVTLDFQVDNTFGQSLVNRAAFLNGDGEEQFVVIFEIISSTDGSVQRTEFTQVLSEEDIQAISNANQLANEVILTTNGASINGELTLQSKAIYALEFSDL